MSLRFIYGRSGSGKTYFCLNEIKEILKKNPEHSLVLLVPEQYTFQAERDLIKVLKTGGILKTEVLSFRRLAFRIFNEAGGITYPHLHSAGKCMIIYQALSRIKDSLKIFAKAAERRGFVNTISALITEFKRYNIIPAELEAARDELKDDALLKDKLAELIAIYSEYQRLVSSSYRDADDDLTMAARKIGDTDLYKGSEIWIDGFAGFTPQEYSLISRLLLKAKRVNISLCTDSLGEQESVKETDVFAAVKEGYRKLSRIAAKTGLEIEAPVCLGTGAQPLPRFKGSPEIAHLESNYFAYPYRIYTQRTTDLALLSSVNIFAEIEAAARDIIRLCRDKEIRYRDIAVMMGDLESYARLVEVIFTEYEIPYFLDRKADIIRHPLIRLVLSMLDIFIDNWSYEAVFRYLKTGLTGLGRESIDQIENYVLACGIRGNRWIKEEEWNMVPELLPQEKDWEKKRTELLAINQIRLEIITPLMEFRRTTKGKNKASEMCGALYDFLGTIGVPLRMEQQIDSFRRSGQLHLADEYAQIWNILMDVFDQIVQAMDEEEIGVERFASILKIGLGEYKVGFIPASVDQVLVGSADRSRSHEVKALYILGVNDGVFPSAAFEEGVLSDLDRAALHKVGVELASDTRTKTFDEQYLIYRALTIPTGYLRLSWPIADQEGRSMRPSMIISRLRKLFPNITETSNILGPASDGEEVELVAGKLPTFKQMAANIQKAEREESSALWHEVYRWYAAQVAWQSQCQALKSAFEYENIAQPVSREKIQSLYGNPMQASVSRLEKYTSCSFAFYLQYGLKVRERKIFRLTPPDVGTFIHNVLEKFSLEVTEQNISWREFDRQWCEERVSLIVDAMLEKMQGSGLSASKRMTALTLRLKRVINRAVWLIAEHIRRGSFDPLGYEIGFGEGEKLPPIVIELDSGEKVYLNGRIDRVDALKTEEGTYLRIIDYKSGNKDFKLADVYYGLQVQLVTYLDALGENNRLGIEAPVLPGGILYFHIDDPLIKAKSKSSGEEIELAIMKQLRMKGLVLADVKLIKEMDKEIDGSSLIIPARINKGDVLGQSSAATLQQFDILKMYVNRLLKQLCSEIMNGTVSIQPLKNKNYNSCQYCHFAAVCQFDLRLKENKFKLLAEQKEEDIWQFMNKDQGGIFNA